MENFLPFALPEIGEDEIKEVEDTLRSGWLTTGPKTARFEKDFADYVGASFALAVNSATAGLHLALEAVGVKAGDEVITTPYTFTASAEVIRYLGADPVFVDILPDTFNIDPHKIEKAITEKTRAILPVHFAGQASDMEKIMEIAKRHGLKVVEDAAHAIPATCNGKMVGTIGDITVFSFYVTKPIATGEGGMVTTGSEEYAKRIKIMRLHGINKDVWDRYTADTPSWYYEVVEPGFKYNMADIMAAIGIHQLKKAEKFQKRREKIATEYSKVFENLPVMLPKNKNHKDIHSWHLYVMGIDTDKITRDEFIKNMSKRGIGTSVHFIPLHIHPYWKNRYGFSPYDFPVAYECYKKAVSLPIYSKMSDEDTLKVIKAVCDILG